MKKRAELIVALDVATTAQAEAVVDGLPEQVSHYKVGLELFSAQGPPVLAALKRREKRIFLDLKLHDIPRTVGRAVATAASHGVDLITIHATGGHDMMVAAAEAAADCGPAGPKLLAVTMLTSLDEDDLRALTITHTPAEHVAHLAEMAITAGVDGLVCSPREAQSLRRQFGPEPILVTPGIRPAPAEGDDQKRVATPAVAVAAGASHLVVGRPILAATNPYAAAEAILAEMNSA